MTYKTAKISDSEWKVMKVLWDDSPLPSSEIIKRLSPYTVWKPKTIHTLITRLVKKNIVGVKKEPSRYLYFPLITKDDCRLKETESFLEKVYNGSVSMLVANFINKDMLTQEELERLKKLLDNDLSDSSKKSTRPGGN